VAGEGNERYGGGKDKQREREGAGDDEEHPGTLAAVAWSRNL
jgi:hypothetical protein